MKTIVLIGPTASGKSALAVEIAQRLGAFILSLDSLSIYKEIDIASAKPTLAERKGIEHFGIDVLAPDCAFSVATFIELFHTARRRCEAAAKPLVIVGGTSFYLKALIDGISETPPPGEAVKTEVAASMRRLRETYDMLHRIDPKTMQNIAPTDRYRIEKMLTLYLSTGTPPSQWFEQHPPQPLLTTYELYEIAVERERLRRRIAQRTVQMVENGLIDEVAELERRYGRAPQSMHAIGIVETLDYLDGRIGRSTLVEQIATHTAQLAKRQRTFNKNQFQNVVYESAEKIMKRFGAEAANQ